MSSITLPPWAHIPAYALTAAYLVGLAILTGRAERYLVRPDRWPRPADILHPRLYTEEGQEARRFAVRFLLSGGLTVLGVWLLIAYAGQSPN